MIRPYQKPILPSCSISVPEMDTGAPAGLADYISAAQLEALALPGLPRTKRGIQKVAAQSGWDFVEQSTRGGWVQLFAVADLPDEAQAALHTLRLGRTMAPRRGRGRPPKSGWQMRLPDVADAIEAVYIERRLSAGLILDLLRADPQGRYPDLPSERSVQRMLRALESDNAALIASVRDPDTYKSRHRLALGQAGAAESYAGEVWELDTTKADVMTIGGRVMVLGVIDRWSRRANFMVADSESGQSVRRFLVETIRKWGVLPTTVVTDNGSGYINAGIRASLDLLGIEHRKCPPGSPEKKPFVERLFGTFSRERLPLLEGFTGHNVADAQKLRARAKKETGRAVIAAQVTPAQLQDILNAWVDGVYNARPHGTTRVAPLARWANSPIPAAAAPAEDILKVALSAHVGTRRVTKRGITWQRGRYWAPALAGWMDREVTVRRDEDDLGTLFVFAPDGTFIATAVNHARAGMSQEDFAVEARRLQAEHDKAARAEWRRKRDKFDFAAAREAVLRRDAESAGKLTVLPIATVPRSTPALDSLAAAATSSSYAIAGPPATAPQSPAADAAVLQHPASPRARMLATDALIAAAEAGDPVDAAELRRARLYVTTTEYRAARDVEQLLGGARRHSTGQ